MTEHVDPRLKSQRSNVIAQLRLSAYVPATGEAERAVGGQLGQHIDKPQKPPCPGEGARHEAGSCATRIRTQSEKARVDPRVRNCRVR